MSERRFTSPQLINACFILASYLFLTIVLAVLRVKTVLIFPGMFLFERFHLAALYIPSLFVLSGLLLKSGRLPRRTMLMLWASPLPFLTAAVMFQLIAGNTSVLSSRVLIDAFGRFPASALFILLLSMELAGLIRLMSYYPDEEDRLFSREELRGFFRIFSFAETSDSIGEETPAGGEEPTLEDRPTMSFPSFPDAPEPIVSSDPIPADQEVSELIRKVLTGKGSTPESAFSEMVPPPEDLPADDFPPAPAGAPQESAFPENDRWSLDSGGTGDPAFAFLAGEELHNEPLDSGLPAGSEETPEILSTAEPIPVETLPEEERDITDISEKLDPQGSEPAGILQETAVKKPRSRKRKKYDVPVEGLLADYPESDFSSIDDNTRKSAEVLEQTLKEFRIEAKVTGIRKGPVITMFELLPSPGVKISSIVNLQDNIALRLAASRVRIIAPIPGKHAVGIEVPNKKRAIVSFSSLVASDEFSETDAGIPVILGKDISGGNQIIDLTRTPHLLIAGATGSGKSVCVNSLIGSILYSRTPREVKMIMVDPKIVELKLYNDIPHLLTPVITNPKRAIQALQWCLAEMERRYSLLDTQGVRDIKTFNKRVNDRKLATEPLPYIVVLVDEFADLMATSGKELEAIVARLAAMSRAVGIHLVLATQRPSVDVITGLIKANFPSRIAFMVAGKTDSRIIIDSVGAEKLLGRGDMLFTSAWDPFPSRMQGAFLAEEEVERLADYVKTLGEPDYIDEEMFIDEEDEEEFQLQSSSADDPMYEKALEIVVSSRKASASYLQRRLKIGYNRAARLVEDMERRGIVGPANGSKPRDLIHIPERFLPGGGSADREPSSA